MTLTEIKANQEAAKKAYSDSPLWKSFLASGAATTDKEAQEMASAEMKARKDEMNRWAKLAREIEGNPSEETIANAMAAAGFEEAGHAAGNINKIFKANLNQ